MWDERYSQPGFVYGTEPNEFLASDWRRTLPAGRFELAPDGMRFVTAQGTWPIAVR